MGDDRNGMELNLLMTGEEVSPHLECTMSLPTMSPLASPAARRSTHGDAGQRRQPRCRQCRRRRQACHRQTHHGRATIAPIRAIHHDGNGELILDPSRPQADVDHRGHMRRDFLSRHQQIQLHPSPIVAHFKSEPYHRLIWIFMAHSTNFDPRMDQRQGNTDRFLLKLHPAVKSPKTQLSSFPIINEAWIGRSRPFIMLVIVPIICQDAHESSAALRHRFRPTTATTSGRRRPSSVASSIFPIGEHPGRPNSTSSSTHHTALRPCCPLKARPHRLSTTPSPPTIASRHCPLPPHPMATINRGPPLGHRQHEPCM
ncbi:hypothetical protein ACLOJK_029284 [Asimina triloba]